MDGLWLPAVFDSVAVAMSQRNLRQLTKDRCYRTSDFDWATTYSAVCGADMVGSSRDWAELDKATRLRCCCVDVDFVWLRKAIIAYAPQLSRPNVSIGRVFNLLQEVYIAGYYMSYRCFQNVQEFIDSPDPLGVLSLRLYFLLVELDRLARHGALTNDGSSILPAATFNTATCLHMVLKTLPPQQIFDSQWPIFMLLGALVRFSFVFSEEVGRSALAERSRLRWDLGPDGNLFRALWDYVAVDDVVALPGPIARLHFLVSPIGAISHFFPIIRPVVELARAELWRQSANATCSSLPLVPFDAVASVLHASPGMIDLMTHSFPVLQLLDRLSLPSSVVVEYGVRLCLPTLRPDDLVLAKASWVRAHHMSGCNRELGELLVTRNVSHLVDVGAMFGTCAAVAAKRFPHLNVVAIEQDKHSVELLHQTRNINGLSNLWPRWLTIDRSVDACVPQGTCSTLSAEYPFYAEPMARQLAQTDGRPERNVSACAGILLWLSEMGGQLQSILDGGHELFSQGLVDIVAINAIPEDVRSVRELLGPGYVLEERPQNTRSPTVVLIGTRSPES